MNDYQKEIENNVAGIPDKNLVDFLSHPRRKQFLSAVDQRNEEYCLRIAAGEAWIRRLLVVGPPRIDEGGSE